MRTGVLLPHPKMESSMSKTFTVAGVSTLEGVVKFRVANGTAAARAKVLERSGHTNIKLEDLKKPMTKEAAYEYLAAKGFKETKEAVAKTPKAAKPAKPAKAKPAPKLKVVKSKPPKTKEVPAAEVIEDAGIVVGGNAPVATAPSTKSVEEIAKIKAKNLETMRKVTNKLRALREF